MKKLILAFICLFSVVPYQAEATCDPNIPGDVSGDCKVDFNDFAIIASDWLKAGEPHEWVARYNSPGNQHDRAQAIAVDSNDNVYVTGIADHNQFDETGGDCVTIKYDPDGNEIWVARYNGQGNKYDTAVAIAIDSSDNVYVTGTTDHNSFDYTGGDCVTIKYDPDGNEIWVARYNGQGNKQDSAGAIAIDSNDNVYVTGITDHNSFDYTSGDCVTIKYDPDGNEIWVARYNGQGNDYDAAVAIAIDSNDNVYVTGIADLNSPYFFIGGDYVTIKYNEDGNELWVATYSGEANLYDRAVAITVDKSDCVYVTGVSGILGGIGSEYGTIKYDPDGNEIWVARYNGQGNNSDGAEAIAIDSNDNVYVTGMADYNGLDSTADYATIKYDTNGNEVWVARYNGSANGFDWPGAIAIDSGGNVYVTGITEFTYNNDYATIKYSPDSNEPVWVARYNGPANGVDWPGAIAIDSFDNVYVTGNSRGSGTEADFATVKYSPDYTCTPPVTGDFNHDCEVNLRDLKVFCQNWLLGVE